MDPKINKLARYRSSKSGKSGKNAARDFHRLVHRDGKLFPVTISTPMIPIRRKVRGRHGKRRSQEKLEKFPCLVLSSWMKEILRECPKFMFGGHDPCTQEGLQQVQRMFKQFWDDFKGVQPGHPIYQRTADEQMRTVPIAIHGDEGRGLGKNPVLVLSYQLIIPHTGPDCLNMSQSLRCIIQKRFLGVFPMKNCFDFNWNMFFTFSLHYPSHMLGIPSPPGFCLLWCHQHGIAKMMQQSTVFTNAWLMTCAACSMKAYLSRFDSKTRGLFLKTWGN